MVRSIRLVCFGSPVKNYVSFSDEGFLVLLHDMVIFQDRACTVLFVVDALVVWPYYRTCYAFDTDTGLPL